MTWEQFGLKKNPYGIIPLLEGGDISITEAFVGREKERTYINNLFRSEERVCLTICGHVGVGKTSITNLEKFKWKYENKEKPLFSFRREIEASDTILDKKSFMLEIIGSVLREIELVDPKLITKHAFLMKLNQMIDITQTMGLSGSLSAGMFGISLQSTIEEKQTVQPFHLTTASLEKQFLQLLDFIRQHKIAGVQYRGLIIHVNNFEVAMTANKKKVLQFFAEIRDFLQTPHLYFIFLGPNNFFKDIISKEARVKSVFEQTPIILSPLSQEELIQALNKRLELLKSPTAKQFIKPFEDQAITALYDLFSGDIRLIMSSLKDIVTHLSDKLPTTLSADQTLFFLGQERLAYIKSILKDEQMKILGYFVSHDQPLTQKEIAQASNKAQTNLSSYYFKPLIEHGIIELKKESGRSKYWGLTDRYLPLKKVVEAEKNIQKHLMTLAKKQELFTAKK